MYAVVACPRCRRSRIVARGRRTTECTSCGRRLVLADLRVYHEGEGFEEAQHAAGLLNAKLAGREEEYAQAILPDKEPQAARHDTPWEAAAAAAREGGPEPDRVDRLARTLSARLGDFGEDDLARAMALANLKSDRVEAHLARMQTTMVLYEPRPGRYKAF